MGMWQRRDDQQLGKIESNGTTNNINDELDVPMPRRVDEPFLKDDRPLAKAIRKITGKTESGVKELKEPLLFLMKNDGYTDIIEGVQPGAFIIEMKNGSCKQVDLRPDKLTSLHYNKNFYRGWIAHEDCATPYPEDPLYSAEMNYKTIQKLSMNWKDTGQVAMMKEKRRLWMYVIGGIILLMLVLNSMGVFDGLLHSASAAVPVAKAVVVNGTQTVKQTIVI